MESSELVLVAHVFLSVEILSSLVQTINWFSTICYSTQWLKEAEEEDDEEEE